MTTMNRLGITFGIVVLLAGCSGFRDSRMNPFNWFGRSQGGPAMVAADGDVIVTDPRSLVAEITSLEITPTTGGAIVTAIGLPPTQGYWDAELVAENFGDPLDGKMTYRFVVFPPPTAMRVSTAPSREVSAAAFLTDTKLAQTSEIIVLAETNSRSSRR